MADPRYDSVRNQYVAPEADQAAVAATYAANGAIGHASGRHALTKTSIGAFTLAVPTLEEDGNRIHIVSRTAFAHVVTVAGGLGGNAADDVLTFAKVGDSIELVADNLKWVPTGAGYGVVIS
jgi:uncharacterized protein with ACT and thioredoxin-like domain